MAGHPGGEPEPPAMPADNASVLLTDQRPWAHEAHLAAQDIEELRRLVDIGPPQQSPEARDSRVVGDLEEALGGLVLASELRLALLGTDARRAKRQKLEWQAPQPTGSWEKKIGPWGVLTSTDLVAISGASGPPRGTR
jgi:hypothetical protein